MPNARWPVRECRRCRREICLVRNEHGQWFPYDIRPFRPHRCGSDVYDLPESDRMPLFIPKDDKRKKLRSKTGFLGGLGRDPAA